MDRVQRLEAELDGFPLTRRYFGKLFRRRIEMPPALDTELVRDILAPGNFARIEALISDLHHITGFDHIFRLGLSASNPDGPILAMFAEINGLQYLHENGYSDLTVELPRAGRTPEFTAQRDGILYLAEVKSLQIMESQNQLETILGGVYVFAPVPPVLSPHQDIDVGGRNTAMVCKVIKRKIRNALRQIQAKATREGMPYWRGVVLIVTTRRLTELDFWDNVCFDALKQSCDQLARDLPEAGLYAGVFISSGGARVYNPRALPPRHSR
jgi:hypothetical protein